MPPAVRSEMMCCLVRMQAGPEPELQNWQILAQLLHVTTQMRQFIIQASHMCSKARFVDVYCIQDCTMWHVAHAYTMRTHIKFGSVRSGGSSLECCRPRPCFVRSRGIAVFLDHLFFAFGSVLYRVSRASLASSTSLAYLVDHSSSSARSSHVL